MSGDYYDTAQICPNGHVTTTTAGTRPIHRQAHCTQCGEATMMECPKCKSGIRGYYHMRNGVVLLNNYKTPAFCHQCGAAFPWTERKQLAAIELFIEETQDQEAQREFRESVEQVAKDTPQAQVASRRITRLLGKIGSHTGTMILDILKGVASEAAKKALFPKP